MKSTDRRPWSGRRTHIELLEEAEKQMQEILKILEKDCGLITGRRTPPSPAIRSPDSFLASPSQIGRESGESSSLSGSLGLAPTQAKTPRSSKPDPQTKPKNQGRRSSCQKLEKFGMDDSAPWTKTARANCKIIQTDRHKSVPKNYSNTLGGARVRDRRAMVNMVLSDGHKGRAWSRYAISSILTLTSFSLPYIIAFPTTLSPRKRPYLDRESPQRHLLMHSSKADWAGSLSLSIVGFLYGVTRRLSKKLEHRRPTWAACRSIACRGGDGGGSFWGKASNFTRKPLVCRAWSHSSDENQGYIAGRSNARHSGVCIC